MDGETEILPGPPPTVVHHRHVVVNGARLHYVEASAQDVLAPSQAAATAKEMDTNSRLSCLLLHGFPEFWYSWRHQIPALAAAGFRAIAPDLRGYNESDKPAGVGNYRLGLLVADVAGLIEQLAGGRAVVVGHDWGGAIAWELAMRRPERVERLVILNAPHPAALQRELRGVGQLLRSWYMLFFQLPLLPEWLLTAGNCVLLERMLRWQPVWAGAFSPEDIRLYKQALSRPGALTAALNYYRAIPRYRGEMKQPTVPIAAPVLLIWGMRDPYLGAALTRGLRPWVPNLRVERLLNASHWVQNDAPERVNRLLLEFLQAGIRH
jgi:pimeloyl-ACP methyl ester carboxylesterase